MFTSFHCSKSTTPALKAAFAGIHIMHVPAPDTGVAPVVPLK